jgi:hypothetical protein
MKRVFRLLLAAVFAGGLIYAVAGSFRYKNYLYSDYVFMLKDKGKIYKLDNQIQLVGDRITGENYILLGLSKNWTYGHEIQKIFMLDNSNYRIQNTDSKFYDGILQMDYSTENPVKITKTENEISLHEKEETEILDINYKGKHETLILEKNNKNPEFKTFRFWICSRRRNGKSCGNPKGYGISIQKLKEKFGLSLDIEIDNKEKAVYFIKE